VERRASQMQLAGHEGHHLRGRAPSAPSMSAPDSLWSMFAILGLVFGTLAGVTAYVIFYEEYRKHFAGDRKKPRAMALRGGLFAFAFFLLTSLAAGYFIPRALSR
jgi:heme/copper-type cytochrome/quinol oxidase subunit 2